MSKKQMRGKHAEADIEEDVEIRKSKKKKKKSGIRKVIGKIFIVLLLLIATCLGVVVGYGYNLYSQIDYDDNIDIGDIWC